jgi:hypothetical protein
MSSRDLPDLVLTMHEVNSQAWSKLSSYYKAVLVKKRARLESTATGRDEREQLCWEIKTIKGFLAHAEAAEKNVAGAG